MPLLATKIFDYRNKISIEIFVLFLYFLYLCTVNQLVMVTETIHSKASEHSILYDIVVPEGNLLRRMNDLIDFSFVYDELSSKYCHDNGRMAENPIRLFKYLLLKLIYDLSDIGVVERTMYDMSFKYFLGMAPDETDIINPSTLCKFRRQRLKDINILDLLVNKSVSIALKLGIIKSKNVIIDSTHTASRSNPVSPIKMLKERSKKLRKALYNIDESIKDTLPKKTTREDLEEEIEYTKSLIKVVDNNEVLANYPDVRERLNMLKESMDDIADHFTTSANDKDARIGHKTVDSSFFGYKSHLGEVEERIITAAVITSGAEGDGQQLGEIIDKTRKNGVEVDAAICDKAYSSDANLKKAKEEGFLLVSRLNSCVSNGLRKEEYIFDFNKDAGMYICPAGHMAIRKGTKRKTGTASNPVTTYYFDINKCKTCSKREGCYKEGAKSKTYSTSIKTKEQTEHMKFQETDEFRELAKKRYMIEAKNAELKNSFGYDRATSYGLECMKLQGALTIFVSNMRRIIKLMK